MPCKWGAKAGMVHVWVAGKTVIPLLHAGRTAPERFRDKKLIYKVLYKFAFFTLPSLTMRAAINPH